MIQQNMIDVVTTNSCPEVTPADLLEEKATPDDLRKLERAMGVFSSCTAFLGALKQVLTDLEGFPEADALEKFIPIMAQVEANAMNDNPKTFTLTMRAEEITETELIMSLVSRTPSPNASQSPKGDNG